MNATLSGKPETVNADPHGAGWMMVLKLHDAQPAAALLDAAAYDDYVRSEAKLG